MTNKISTGQIRRIAIQNPELFHEIAESMGYIKLSEVKKEAKKLKKEIVDIVKTEHRGIK